MPQHATRNGIILVLFGALFFGLLPSAAQLAYDDGANVLFVIMFRALVGIAVFLIIMAATGRNAGLSLGILRRSWLTGLSSAGGALGLFASIRYIDISQASMVLFLYPFPVAVIAHIRGQTRLTLPVVCLMALATFGTYLVIGVSTETPDWRGLAFAFLGMASFTVMIMVMSDLTKQVGAIGSNLVMAIWSLGIFSLVALIGPSLGLIAGADMPDNPVGWVYCFAVGLTFAFGYLFYFLSADKIGPARASLLSTSEPVMMILFAMAILGETLNPLQWVGVVLVVGGMTLSEVFRR